MESLIAHSDSQLVAQQVKGKYEAKDQRMAKYLDKTKEAILPLKNFKIVEVPRNEDSRASELSRLATLDYLDRTAFVEILQRPSIEEPELVLPIQHKPSWVDEIIAYPRDEKLPEDREEARKARLRATRYLLIGEDLYKRSFTLPYLKCLRPTEAEYALREVFEGICGQHLGGRNLAHKILRQGYYWPTLLKDAQEFAKKCD